MQYRGYYGYCPDNGWKVYVWQLGRGVTFATFDYAFMYSGSGVYGAYSEWRDHTHMEPAGTQCFGGGYLCTPSEYGYDLSLWNNESGYWQQWDDSRPTVVTENQAVQGFTSRYWHNPSQYWYRFTTTGVWQ